MRVFVLFAWSRGLILFFLSTVFSVFLGAKNSPLWAVEDAFPRIQADSVYLNLWNRNSGLYDWQELLELSLLGSGVSLEDKNEFVELLRSWLLRLHRQVKAVGGDGISDYLLGEEILNSMYGFLKEYQSLQTRMDVMFRDGSYNCVTSSLLYVVLARGLGLSARGVGTYNHSFVNVELADGRHIDVETTSRYGFDPGQKKEFLNTFTQETGLVYVPKKKYQKRELLSDNEFVGLILQNRLYLLNQSRRDFRVLEQMIPLAADLATLTQLEEAVQNFFSMVSQYSFRLSQSGEVARALDFTDMVLETYGSRKSLVKVRNIIAYNDVLSLLERADYDRAEERLASYRQRTLLTEESNAKLVLKLYGDRFQRLLRSKNLDREQKIAAFSALAKNSSFPEEQKQLYYRVLFQNEALELIRRNQYEKARQWMSRYPDTSSQFYRKMLFNIERSYIVYTYNHSLTHIKKGAYQEAEILLEEGLAQYPGNPKLLKLQASLARLKANAG